MQQHKYVLSLLVMILLVSPVPAAAEDFTLGVLGPFSGQNAAIGEEMKGAVTMAFDAIDWHIGDATIEVVWIDSQSDQAKSMQAYEEAVVRDGIQAGLLNWHSSVALSCMEVAAEYHIPHLFTLGATPDINKKFHSDPEKYGVWGFKGWPAPRKLILSYVQTLEDAIKRGVWKPSEKTVAIYAEESDWGRSFGNVNRELFEGKGWNVVDEHYFPMSRTEYYLLLSKVKELDPAVVAMSSTISVSAFIRQAHEIGVNSLIIADGLGWIGEWYELTGEASNYVLDQIPGWATEEGKKYAQHFEERWGKSPSPSSGGLSYDGANFFIALANAAIEQYGELSSETIYTFMQEDLWTGKWSYKDGIVMQEYAATPETIPDPVVGKGYYIFPVLQYFDGEGKIIFPPEWAEQALTPRPE